MPPEEQTPDNDRLTLTTIEQVETQAKILQNQARRLIVLAAQCPAIDPFAIQGLNGLLMPSTNLLRYISDIKSDKVEEGRFLGGHGYALGNRCC